jgi:hypothetical protein
MDDEAGLEGFFSGQEAARAIFNAVRRAVAEIGPYELRVSKSQVAFRLSRTFAIAWMPAQYLRRKAAPLVLTVSLSYRHPSLRWKEIVQPAPGRFTHHLELYDPAEVDEEVLGWLKEAWETAC